MNKKTLAKRILYVLVAVMACACVAFLAFASDYYRADSRARDAMTSSGQDRVKVQELDDGNIAFVPQEPVAGLVFYPGGKVEPTAYAPLLRRCAEQDVLSVLVQPPFNLAFFSAAAADKIIAEFPGIDTWIVAGHSLGGVVASSYTAAHGQDVDGLLLLAAYPSDDMSDYAGNVISMAGSNDQVLNREKFAASPNLLPPNAETRILQGGNHAGFGDYGAQAGDGIATISPEEQQAQAVEAVTQLVAAA